MSNLKVTVLDANNVNLEVIPQPRIEARIDRGTAGPQGPTGPTGAQGQGINMKGTVATVEDLPTTGNVNGDGYVVLSNGNVYVWSDS